MKKDLILKVIVIVLPIIVGIYAQYNEARIEKLKKTNLIEKQCRGEKVSVKPQTIASI